MQAEGGEKTATSGHRVTSDATAFANCIGTALVDAPCMMSNAKGDHYERLLTFCFKWKYFVRIFSRALQHVPSFRPLMEWVCPLALTLLQTGGF